MKLAAFFVATLLVGLVFSAPTTNDEDTITVTSEFFPDELAIYTAEHDIVNILVPLNALNFEDDSDENDDDDNDTTADTVLFFVLADSVEGKSVDQGLYIRKAGVVTKLLDNGRDATAANDETKIVYFGAKDGIYSYNAKDNTAEKYGTITDSIIGIAKVNGSDVIYILTEDHALYKVTEEGTKKELVESVVNAQQIVLDYENNLYYYTPDKNVYVLTADEVKKIEGLPEQASSLNILKPPFIFDNGVPIIIDNKSYIAFANTTSESGSFEFQVKPTAYSMEATIIQYYGYNKKIFEYNILGLVVSELLADLRNYLSDKSDSISEIATRSRSDLKA